MAEVFNLAAVYGQAEAIKAARDRNVLAGLNIQAAKRRERNLELIRQTRTQFENGGEVVKKLREAGEFDAADMFVNTQMSSKLVEINFIKSLAPLITDAASYEQFRGQLLEEGAIEEGDLPVSYNSSIFKNLNKQANLELAKFKLAVEKAGFQRQKFNAMEDRERKKLGLEARRVAVSEKRERRIAEDAKAPSTGKSRLAFQMAAHTFNGMIDPITHQISGVDESNIPKVIKMASLIMKYNEQGLEMNEARLKAARDIGVKGLNPEDDPDFIREAYNAFPD